MVSCCLTAACYLFFCLEASPRACFVLPGTFNWQLQLAAFTRLPQLFLLHVLRHHFDDFCYLLLVIFSFPPLDIFLINWHIQKQRHSYYIGHSLGKTIICFHMHPSITQLNPSKHSRLQDWLWTITCCNIIIPTRNGFANLDLTKQHQMTVICSKRSLCLSAGTKDVCCSSCWW